MGTGRHQGLLHPAEAPVPYNRFWGATTTPGTAPGPGEEGVHCSHLCLFGFCSLGTKAPVRLGPLQAVTPREPEGLFPAARLCRAGPSRAVGMDFSRTLSQLRAQQRMWMCHRRSRGQGSAPSQTICSLNSHRHEPAAWPLRLGLGFQNERLGN